MPHGRFVGFQVNGIATVLLDFIPQVLVVLDLFLHHFGFCCGVTSFQHFAGNICVGSNQRRDVFVEGQSFRFVFL